MRIIKFRGKRLDNGEWVVGDLEYNPRKNLARIHTYDNDGDYLNQHIVDSDTVGQFSGLKDHFGKEIYEGDMLICPDVPAISLEVYYNPKRGSFCLAEHTLTAGVHHGTTQIGEMIMLYPDMRIIDNIHDNPETKKGGQE